MDYGDVGYPRLINTAKEEINRMDFWTGTGELAVWGFLIRALIVYIYIFLILKVLGQRSIGTIHPLDFLFGIIIGDILGEPLSSGTIPLAGPLAAAAMIASLHLVLSYLALKNPRYRRVIEDEPLLLIEKGRILHKQLKKTRITVESLLMDLRLNNTANPLEVDYAILESNGKISVIKKSQYNPVTPYDLNIDSPPVNGYTSVLIQDGRIIQSNVEKFGSLEWLIEQIQEKGFDDPTEIFLLTMNEGGKIYISEK